MLLIPRLRSKSRYDVTMRFVLIIAWVMVLVTHAAAQNPSAPLELTAVVVDAPRDGETVEVLLAFRNTSSETVSVCIQGSGYSAIHDEPSPKDGGASQLGIHNCLSRDSEQFWLVLPGESRIESHPALKAVPNRNDYTLTGCGPRAVENENGVTSC